MAGIGTLREKPLHAALKAWCARPGDRTEVPLAGFVVDVVRDDLLIEVQTGGFASLKDKVPALLDLGHRVRIVHPIAVAKWIVKTDEHGSAGGRKSPRRGDVTDVFAALVSFPRLIDHPRFEVEVVLTMEEEVRIHTPGRSWRRRGWSVAERRLLEVVDTVLLGDSGDLLGLLPPDLPPVFTTADLAAGLGRPLRTAQQMAYCLRQSGAIRTVGKRGNTAEYRIGRIVA